jgi:hypothetical protein
MLNFLKKERKIIQKIKKLHFGARCISLLSVNQVKNPKSSEW